MASPGSSSDASASDAAAVCCMCGDRGLASELFQCNLCRLRLQHKYCSDLYPSVPSGPYRSCNWCLIREDSGGVGGSPVKAAAAGAKRRLSESRDDDDGVEEAMKPFGTGCTRSQFSEDPEKPVKKPKSKKGRQRQVPQPVAATKTTEAKERREAQAGAGGKTRLRVKVRRYKLLAEVIC